MAASDAARTNGSSSRLVAEGVLFVIGGISWGCSRSEREVVLAFRARTEGWAAGRVLLLAGWRAGIGKRQRSEEQALFDYFAQEVLALADEDTRRVLLQTAVLPRVAGPMAVQLTGVARAGEILSDLARRGCFVVRHEAETPTYQYHALFREFLLGRAEGTLPPPRRAALRVSAAALLEESGQVEDAFQLFVQAGAWDGASRIILASAPSLLGAGRAETVARWVLALPEDLRSRDPWLLLWSGCGTAQSLPDPGGARRQLERAFDLFRADGDAAGVYLAWATVQKKPLEMLRLLVAHGPRGVRQDLLAEALWPDAEGDAAHRALGTTVYRLRKLLGKAEVVLQQDGRVALDPREVFVDAWALEQLLLRVDAAAPGRAGAADGAAPRARARELYRGDLFGPAGDDPALAPERDRLRRRVQRCLRGS